MEAVRRALTYVRESKDELKKVTWPTRDEVTSFTIVVIVAVLVISFFLWFIDLGLMQITQKLVK
ncbi:MAG: preprotein translocase subunit SecE [Spirochaetes bacterium]|nr:preprotein translocase subunit SecE [Spirochaetota bacterium]